MVLLSLTGLDLVLLGFNGFYRVFTRLHWVLPSFTGLARKRATVFSFLWDTYTEFSLSRLVLFFFLYFFLPGFVSGLKEWRRFHGRTSHPVFFSTRFIQSNSLKEKRKKKKKKRNQKSQCATRSSFIPCPFGLSFLFEIRFDFIFAGFFHPFPALFKVDSFSLRIRTRRFLSFSLRSVIDVCISFIHSFIHSFIRWRRPDPVAAKRKAMKKKTTKKTKRIKKKNWTPIKRVRPCNRMCWQQSKKKETFFCCCSLIFTAHLSSTYSMADPHWRSFS